MHQLIGRVAALMSGVDSVAMPCSSTVDGDNSNDDDDERDLRIFSWLERSSSHANPTTPTPPNTRGSQIDHHGNCDDVMQCDVRSTSNVDAALELREVVEEDLCSP